MLDAHRDDELSVADVARLALKTGRLDRAMLDGVREKAIVAFIGHILRSEHFAGEHGERVRRFHCYRKFVQSEDGKEVQRDLWRTIDAMTRVQMFDSAKSRLQQSKAIQESVAVDVAYWDANVAPKLRAKEIGPDLNLQF